MALPAGLGFIAPVLTGWSPEPPSTVMTMQPALRTEESPEVEHDPVQAETDERRRRSTLVLIGAFLTVLLLIVAIGAIIDTDAKSDDLTLSPGEYVFTALDGGDIDLADFSGQPLVVNFFASWCAPCRAEMPDLEAVHQERAGAVSFVGLNAGEVDEEAARELIEQTGVSYPIGLEADAFIDEVNGLGMPTTAFFDSNGRLVDTHTGLLTADALRELIDELN